jgi:hypothetical protein
MLRFWIERVIYGLLLVCVGGVGSLTYFDAFLPHHAHPYHLTILEGLDHAHNPLPLPAETAQEYLRQRLETQFAPYPILLAGRGSTPGLAFFIQSTLSQGYVLTNDRIEFCAFLALTGRLPFPGVRKPWFLCYRPRSLQPSKARNPLGFANMCSEFAPIRSFKVSVGD